MHSLVRRLVLLAVGSLAALLTVGAATAGAHGGPGHGLGRTSATALVREAAEQLDVTVARLTDAIEDAAVARVDEAVQDGDVDADDADELKEEARENLRLAISLSRTRVVASNLGITTARLNTGFRAARRALIVERIDEAVEDGDLEAAEAAELKEELADAELPGYKAFGYHGFGYGRGFGR
jgi:polyhydroxyalkanoate synthesis regulator phasin